MGQFASIHLAESASLVTQAAGDYNDAGIFEPGAESATDVTVVTWPPTGNDAAVYRDILMEGARVRDALWFALEEDIAPIRVGPNATDGDIIRYNSLDYRARAVASWGSYQQVLAVREEGQDD